jgi:hypothetical protein
MTGAAKSIEAAAMSWDGLTVVPHRFGGREFRVGRREIGHIHGDALLDLPFPITIRKQLVAEHRAAPHHILPDTGWVSFRIRTADDIECAIELLRLNYERPWLSDGS